MDENSEGPPEHKEFDQVVAKHHDEHKVDGDSDTEPDEGTLPLGSG